MSDAFEPSESATTSALASLSPSRSPRSRRPHRRAHSTPGAFITSDDEDSDAETSQPSISPRTQQLPELRRRLQLQKRESSSVTSTLSEIKAGKARADDEEQEDTFWTCHICLEEASEPVLSLCGHLFCWNCLSEWFEMQAHRPATCPVCKAGSGKDKVVPIYGRGKVEFDPRSRPAPPRPRAVPPPGPPQQRPTRTMAGLGPFFGGAPQQQNGMQFHAGLFPFPGLSWTWSSGGQAQQAPRPGQDQPPPHPALHLFALLFMSWLFMQILIG